MDAKDFLFFDKMLTPQIIVGLYWIALIAVVLSSVGLIFSGEFIRGIATLFIGGLIVRVYSEFVCVIFQLNKNVQKIAERGEETQPAEST